MLTLDDAAELIAKLIAKTVKVDRQALAQQWSQKLMRAAVAGSLKTHDAMTRIPIMPEREGAIVSIAIRGAASVQEINRWLSEQGVDLILSETVDATPKAVRIRLKEATVTEHAKQLMNRWANQYFEKEGLTPTREQVLKAIYKDLNRHFNKDWEFSYMRRHLLLEWTFVPFAPGAQKAQNITL